MCLLRLLEGFSLSHITLDRSVCQANKCDLDVMRLFLVTVWTVSSSGHVIQCRSMHYCNVITFFREFTVTNPSHA